MKSQFRGRAKLNRNLAVALVGSDMTLRRFTPAAEKLLGLIPADVGQPVTNINPRCKFRTFIP
jgi:PAS domain